MVNFARLPTPKRVTGSELAALRDKRPFLLSLLVETGLTSPMLQARLGPLTSAHAVRIQDGRLFRCHALAAKDWGIVEVSEMEFPTPDHPWADVDGPLGPWLAAEGFVVEKTILEALHFEPCEELSRAFSLELDAPCWGRRYQLRAGPESAAVTEIWHPDLF